MLDDEPGAKSREAPDVCCRTQALLTTKTCGRIACGFEEIADKVPTAWLYQQRWPGGNTNHPACKLKPKGWCFACTRWKTENSRSAGAFWSFWAYRQGSRDAPNTLKRLVRLQPCRPRYGHGQCARPKLRRAASIAAKYRARFTPELAHFAADAQSLPFVKQPQQWPT